MEPEQLLHQLIQRHERAQRDVAFRLHDDIGQELAVVALRLSILRKTVNQVADIPAALAELQGLLSSVHKKIRDLEHAVYPRIAELNFGVAVEGLVDRFRTEHGASISLVNRLGSVPAAGQAVPAFQTLEDLLGLVFSGGAAPEVHVELVSSPRMLSIVLSGPGTRGILDGWAESGDLPRARAAAHGGVIEGDGRHLTCSFPLAVASGS